MLKTETTPADSICSSSVLRGKVFGECGNSFWIGGEEFVKRPVKFVSRLRGGPMRMKVFLN